MSRLPAPRSTPPAAPPRSPTLEKAKRALRLDIRRAQEEAKRYRISIGKGVNNRQMDAETRRATLEQLAQAYQFVADYLRDFLQRFT